VVVAVAHDDYKALDEEYFLTLAEPDAVIADIKNMYAGKLKQLTHWTL
jgi:UDP-N-acetyl-D-galactosamine dehydrogenase